MRLFEKFKIYLIRFKSLIIGVEDFIRYRDALAEIITNRRQAASRNPLNAVGWKAFSQNDEDGLTLEITSRLGLKRGTFLEFGVGDGLENNSIILLAKGWNGVWVGGQEILPVFSSASRVRFLKRWVSKDNLSTICRDARSAINSEKFDVISIDLDGNDLHFVEHMLTAGERPRLWIVEYNAKFPPPIRFCINYDPDHIWDKSDYQGASLQCFVDLFEKYGYTLIVCNSWSGSNAYFILNEWLSAFPERPVEISDIYVSASYLIRQVGHPTSPKTIEILAQAEPWDCRPD